MSQLYMEGRKHLNAKNYKKALEVFTAGDVYMVGKCVLCNTERISFSVRDIFVVLVNIFVGFSMKGFTFSKYLP